MKPWKVVFQELHVVVSSAATTTFVSCDIFCVLDDRRAQYNYMLRNPERGYAPLETRLIGRISLDQGLNGTLLRIPSKRIGKSCSSPRG
jgi:hypothetical protein